MRHPDTILADLETVAGDRRTAEGRSALDLLHEAFFDLRDSYRLAMSLHPDVSPETNKAILLEVDDYVDNHYGLA